DRDLAQELHRPRSRPQRRRSPERHRRHRGCRSTPGRRRHPGPGRPGDDRRGSYDRPAQMIEELRKPQSWLEILIIAVAFYFILGAVRGTRGAGILKGIVFLFIITFLGALFLAERFHLENIQRMLTWLLSGSTIAIIVLFAPEMRRGLSLLAQSRVLSPFLRSQSSGIIDELANAAVKLSKNRIGALVAIERDIGLGEYVEHGVRIDAALTSELLES